jgi:hypothetical protein
VQVSQDRSASDCAGVAFGLDSLAGGLAVAVPGHTLPAPARRKRQSGLGGMLGVIIGPRPHSSQGLFKPRVKV